MKRGSTLFLKIVILLIALVALIGMVWFPQTEGRAANLDLISIYLDPVIIFAYIASTPFFWALSEAFKILGLIEQNKTFSSVTVKHLRNIKYAAIAMIGFIIASEALLMNFGVEEDAAGPMALGIYLAFATIVFATGVAVAQKLLQNAVDIKSENDLTV